MDDSPLEPMYGVRPWTFSVLDCSAALPASFCAQLLGAFGGQILRIDDLRFSNSARTDFKDEFLTSCDLYSAYVQRDKESLELDLRDPSGRGVLHDRVRTTDMLIEDRRTNDLATIGLDRTTLFGLNPRLVLVSITPYGRTHSEAQTVASDLTLYHGGGLGFATPGLVNSPVNDPPLRLGSHQGEFVSGLAAAINASAAMLRQLRWPHQGPSIVDFSCHKAMANVFRQDLGSFAYYQGGLNRDVQRGRGAGGTVERRNLRCEDGWVNLSWAGVQQWDSLRQMLDEPLWMNDDRLSTPHMRYRNWSVIWPHLEEWAAAKAKEEIFLLCQAHRIPCAPVNSGSELLRSALLESRAYWDERDDARKMPGLVSKWWRVPERTREEDHAAPPS